MVQDSRTRDDGRKWQEMPCCVVGFNMESVVRSPGKWHDQSFIVEISLRLHVASGLQLKHCYSCPGERVVAVGMAENGQI